MDPAHRFQRGRDRVEPVPLEHARSSDRLGPDVTESDIDLGRRTCALLQCQQAGSRCLGDAELLGHLLPLSGAGAPVRLRIRLALLSSRSFPDEFALQQRHRSAGTASVHPQPSRQMVESAGGDRVAIRCDVVPPALDPAAHSEDRPAPRCSRIVTDALDGDRIGPRMPVPGIEPVGSRRDRAERGEKNHPRTERHDSLKHARCWIRTELAGAPALASTQRVRHALG